MPNYPVTSSYGMYQPAPQYPVSQDTKAPLPDSYTQATYNPAGEVPPQYQPGQPPAYQSVTSGAHPTGTAGPLQKQAQPPPYRTSTNQYEPPVTQYQNMSLQSENPPPAYQPSVQPAPNQAPPAAKQPATAKSCLPIAHEPITATGNATAKHAASSQPTTVPATWRAGTCSSSSKPAAPASEPSKSGTSVQQTSNTTASRTLPKPSDEGQPGLVPRWGRGG